MLDRETEGGYRYRENIKQTAKGIVQIDITGEVFNTHEVIRVRNPTDLADLEKTPLTEFIWKKFDEHVIEGHKRKLKIAGIDEENGRKD